MDPHKHLMVLKEFPFKQTFSLVPLIIYWKRKTKSENHIESTLAQLILKNLDNSIELLDIIDDQSVIDKNISLVESMLTALISPYQMEHNLFGISKPYLFDFFYASTSMEAVFGKRAQTLLSDLFSTKNQEINFYGPTLHAYARILKEFYGADTQFDIPVMTVNKYDEALKIVRSYAVSIDHNFVNIEPRKKPRKLSASQISELSTNFYDLDLWLKTLPPEDFEMKGFAVVHVMESTQQQSISLLKDELLNKNAITYKDNFTRLENAMQSLLELPELSLGIAVFTSGCQGLNNYNKTWQSILPNPKFVHESYANSIYQKAAQSQDGVFIIKNLENYPNPTKIELSLLEAGIKSMIVVPLYFENKMVGVLEMASPNKNELNPISWMSASKILPLFSNSANRVILDMNNDIKAKIQEEFTAIHPIVEWRFIEEASGLIRKENEDDDFVREPILFKDVYPLYGAADIRSSSHERNKAIQFDLSEQLNIAANILKHAFDLKKLPVLNQIRFEINLQLKKIKDGLTSGDEIQIIDFLKREVEPVFTHLKDTYSDLRDIILDYENKIDADLGILYNRRGDFETSLEMLNDSICKIIDKQENNAQTMFPHYFEKYRTDGIEYNIYIGQSLLKEKKFNRIYLKNLRLWQLIMMCHIARITNKLKKKLPIPLEITLLILVHSNSLSIKFREDEKKFDVEGGYNIRYEIIKKRIDKALIKGTKERLTKPGYIAIIYSLQEELNEYQKFISYLISINYLSDKLENFELEDMQGVYGLKALRVEINLKDAILKDLDNIEKIAIEVENVLI